MGLIGGLGALQYATQLSFGSAGAMMNVNQSREALAENVGNQVAFGGGLSSAQTADVAQMDKAMELQGVMAQTNYQVSQAMFAGAKAQMKKDHELREKLMADGALFPGI